MEHLGVFKNLKRVRAFQIELEFGSVVFKEREQLESPEETSQSKGEDQQQT